ncbi:hypothetical protein DN53_04745 [Flagellimonas olearia]|uniref:Uncharacterized protein n=1 Tax=Flagellimonas olearia TaxID=552546 RepID=A0A444VS23_9FLAO|nr:hypothetical protein DN53_04745 [Allomuricauda olearia]
MTFFGLKPLVSSLPLACIYGVSLQLSQLKTINKWSPMPRTQKPQEIIQKKDLKCQKSEVTQFWAICPKFLIFIACICILTNNSQS